MNHKEISLLKNPTVSNLNVKVSSSIDGGAEHPLWTMLNAYFPPQQEWNRLSGAFKGQVLKAADYLHKNNIPYNFYIQALQKFNMGGYKNKAPLVILKYKQNKNGVNQFLYYYVELMKYLFTCFSINENIILLNDVVVEKYDCYSQGILKFIYQVRTLKNYLENNTNNDVLFKLAGSRTLEQFLISLSGEIEEKKEYLVTAGKDKSEIVKQLIIEMKNRKEGKINPVLSKYFTTKNLLNKKGLSLIND